jgi:hypothetical protein
MEDGICETLKYYRVSQDSRTGRRVEAIPKKHSQLGVVLLSARFTKGQNIRYEIRNVGFQVTSPILDKVIGRFFMHPA